MRRVGIVRDQRFIEHRTGVHHIEVPRRLETIYSMLDADGRLKDRLVEIVPRFASLEEMEMVHGAEYVEKILDTAGEPLRYLDPDTVTSEQSCRAAFLAVGGVLEAVRSVAARETDTAFALIRPPGHHAERNRQMGFCLFNNAALAAEYARHTLGFQRVLIVDFDVHHPNGTQHIFEQTAQVLLFSSHRYPFFPGTGDMLEVGLGDGRGYSVNVPLPAQRDDSDLVLAYRRLLEPLAREFQPQLILVSAGFDAHFDDPIGGMRVSEHGFAALAQIVLGLADELCGGKSVFMLEGGYDLGALRKSTRAVLEAMLDGVPDAIVQRIEGGVRPASPVHDIIKSVAEVQGQYWRCFRNV
jgi:acetoin utilization deacetylase AcuC-like enzyme